MPRHEDFCLPPTVRQAAQRDRKNEENHVRAHIQQREPLHRKGITVLQDKVDEPVPDRQQSKKPRGDQQPAESGLPQQAPAENEDGGLRRGSGAVPAGLPVFRLGTSRASVATPITAKARETTKRVP